MKASLLPERKVLSLAEDSLTIATFVVIFVNHFAICS